MAHKRLAETRYYLMIVVDGRANSELARKIETPNLMHAYLLHSAIFNVFAHPHPHPHSWL